MLKQHEIAARTMELTEEGKLRRFNEELPALSQWLPPGYRHVFAGRDLALAAYDDRLVMASRGDGDDETSVLQIEMRLFSHIVAIETTVYPEWYVNYSIGGLREADQFTGHLKPKGRVIFDPRLHWAGDEDGALTFPVSGDYQEFDLWIGFYNGAWD